MKFRALIRLYAFICLYLYLSSNLYSYLSAILNTIVIIIIQTSQHLLRQLHYDYYLLFTDEENKEELMVMWRVGGRQVWEFSPSSFLRESMLLTMMSFI